MRTAEVEIVYKDKPVTVKLCSLTGGQENDCSRKASKISNIASGNPTLDVDPWKLNDWKVYYSIVEPLELKSMEVLSSVERKENSLEGSEYKKLLAAVNQLNEITPLSSGTSEGQ